LKGFLPSPTKSWLSLLHRALMHAEDADLAHVGIGDDLEDMRQHMLGRIGHGGEGSALPGSPL
jgi:hypothetical protein